MMEHVVQINICFWGLLLPDIPTTTKDKIIPITDGYIYPLPFHFNTHRAHVCLSLILSHLHTHFQKVRTFRVKKMVLYSLSHHGELPRGPLTALPLNTLSPGLSFLHHPPAVSLSLSQSTSLATPGSGGNWT